MAEIQMIWKACAVLKLYDSFTGRSPSTSEFRITMEEDLSVVRKQEGVLVFVEHKNRRKKECCQVCLESPVYVPVKLSIPMTGQPQVLHVWLSPSASYPASGQAARLYGHAWPEAELSFCFTDGSERMKLLSDVEAGSGSIRLYHPGRRSLEGRLVELEAGGRRERFLLLQAEPGTAPETGVYTVSRTEGGGFSRLETQVRLVHETKADKTGNYMLLFKGIAAAGAKGRLSVLAGGEKTEIPATVYQGRAVRLDVAKNSDAADGPADLERELQDLQ